MTLKKKPLENIVGKGENAGNQHFLLFPQCFPSIHPQKNFCFSVTFILSSANAFNLDQSKNLSFGKELSICYAWKSILIHFDTVWKCSMIKILLKYLSVILKSVLTNFKTNHLDG